MIKYSLFIPAYNEEKIIRTNVLKVWNYLRKNDLLETVKIIVLNDGSTDNTRKIIENLLNSTVYGNSIELINDDGPSRRENLIKNMINVNTQFVGFMDCDLATDLKDLRPLLECINYYDVVTGSRYMAGSKINRLLSRRIISFCFNNGLKTLFGSKLRDHECGFKMWKTNKLRKIVKYTGYGKKYKDRKMFWDSEMWIWSQRLRMTFLEIPVTWNEGKKSALRFRSELSMIKYILKLRWKLWKNNK